MLDTPTKTSANTSSLSLSGDIPNSSDHFAIGDIAKWSGIKRCGAALHMGQIAAVNIHQLFRQRQTGAVPDFMKMDEMPPMIGLAIGKQALGYWPGGGTTFGADVLEEYFGKDLGFTSKHAVFSAIVFRKANEDTCSLLESSPARDEDLGT